MNEAEMSQPEDPLEGPDRALDEAAIDAKGVDFLQLGFWAALAVAGAAAGMALAWREAVGSAGAVLVIALGAMALVLALWAFRGAGRKLGMFPEKGAAAAAAQPTRKTAWLDALQEPALISDKGGATVAANPAYSELASISQHLGESSHVPSMDRLFSGNPGMAQPIYRLSMAVKAGETRTEILPAILLGEGSATVQFEASVAPLGETRALWRLRRIENASTDASSVDARALYVEDAPIGFFAARRDSRVVYVNQTLRQTLGLPDEPAGLRLEDILRPEGMKLLKREGRGAASQRADVIMRARDGVELPATLITSWTGKGSDSLTRSVVYFTAGAEQFASQPMTRGSSVSMDTATSITDGHKSDDTMFIDAPFGVVRLDGDAVENAVMLDANRALLDMTKGRAQPGSRFADLFAAQEGPNRLSERLNDALDGAVNLRLAGEEDKIVDVFVALDRQGKPSAAYVIDVTEKLQLEQRLAAGEKLQAMGKLTGSLAHDFANMLQAIIFNVNKLQIRHPPGDPTYVELKNIFGLAARGAELITAMKAWSRIQVFRREVFDVSDVISDYYVLLRDIIDERIRLDIVHGRDLPRIHADKRQLETALTNLCTNARDAMLEKNGKGTLTIKTSAANGDVPRRDGFVHAPDGDYVLIEIIDDGAGIPPELMQKIFEPLFTTKADGKGESKGTGYGLATVYGIVKQSGGYIYPVSKLGKGTTFKILLPAFTGEIEEAEVEQPNQLDVAPASLEPANLSQGSKRDDLAGRGRILLVEDEESIRGMAAHLLTSCGYQVMEAEDGEKALVLAKEHAGEIDIMISDVVMPGMDGPTLLHEARAYLGNARVIFISGYAERDLAKTLEEERAISFMPKPFTLRQLAERVKQELDAMDSEAA